MTRLLVLQAGQPATALRNRAGDYVDWFADALGPEVQLEIVPSFLDVRAPAVRHFDGVLMTGSPLTVRDYDRAPWMPSAARELLDAASAGVPVLGICFGLQLLARALGGAVEKNARGREVGTMEIALTDAGRRDAVLGALPELRFQTTHEDAVTRMPAEATLLAENDFGVQAFSIGAEIRAVQFHPELDVARARTLIETRAEVLQAEGILESARAGLRETPSSPLLLRRWIATLGR